MTPPGLYLVLEAAAPLQPFDRWKHGRGNLLVVELAHRVKILLLVVVLVGDAEGHPRRFDLKFGVFNLVEAVDWDDKGLVSWYAFESRF